MKVKSDHSDKAFPKSVKVEGQVINDKKNIAYHFNKFFTSFESDKEIPDEDCIKFTYNIFNKNIRHKLGAQFSFKETSLSEVEKTLDAINVKSSPGISEIQIKVIKACKPIIIPFIVKLFNDCIAQGDYIEEWKCAIVTPLYKKGDMDSLNNYRGISVLAPFNKSFERILEKQIKDFFLSNKLFNKNQHGFRISHSCETALHEILNFCGKNLDLKKIIALLFVDFKKAFDMLKRCLFIYKLLNYGFDNLSVKLIGNYFSKRSQIVKIDEVLSDKCELDIGVPQGSILGQLFFIIFINDLPDYLEEILSKLFADDTTLMFSSYSFDSLNDMLKKGIERLNEWCKYNQLYINWDKTKIMFIT